MKVIEQTYVSRKVLLLFNTYMFGAGHYMKYIKCVTLGIYQSPCKIRPPIRTVGSQLLRYEQSLLVGLVDKIN